MSKQTGKCKLTLNRERERAKSGLEAKKDFPEKKSDARGWFDGAEIANRAKKMLKLFITRIYTDCVVHSVY